MAKIEISPSNLEKNIQEDTATPFQRPSSSRRTSSVKYAPDNDNIDNRRTANWWKWLALLFGLFSLLSIAAIVGMIYSPTFRPDNGTEISAGSPVLISKETGTPIGTNQVIQKNRADKLYMMSPDQLEKITSITVPEGEGYRIARVSSIYLVYNESATVTTLDGKIYEITREGFFVPGTVGTSGTATPGTTDTTTDTPTIDISTGPVVVTGRRRKLLDVGGNGAFVTSYGYSTTIDPWIKGAPAPGPSYIPCNYYCQENCTTTYRDMPMDLQICNENCDVNCQEDYPLSACIYLCSNECSAKYPGDSCAINTCNNNCKNYCEGQGYVDSTTSTAPPPPSTSSPETVSIPAPASGPTTDPVAAAPGPSTDYAVVAGDYAVAPDDYVASAPQPTPSSGTRKSPPAAKTPPSPKN
jgi:hypothetical protein